MAEASNVVTFKLKKQCVKITLPYPKTPKESKVSFKILSNTSNSIPEFEVTENNSKYIIPLRILEDFKYPESVDKEISKNGFSKDDLKTLGNGGIKKISYKWGNLYAWSTPTFGSTRFYYFKSKKKDWALCIELSGPTLSFQDSDLQSFSITDIKI